MVGQEADVGGFFFKESQGETEIRKERVMVPTQLCGEASGNWR